MSKSLTFGIIPRLQGAAMAVVLIVAVGLAAWTLAGAMGLVPVVDLPLTFGETTFDNAGLIVQAGLAALLLTIAATLPAGQRVLELERSHRDFAIAISDVAEAYRVCHAADRSGAFTMSAEFDSVKERYRFLRDHPDLGDLEPEVLEAAAEMSHVSRDLARIYGDEAMARARGFLDQRQEEAEAFAGKIQTAKVRLNDLRRRIAVLDDEERVMKARLRELDNEYGEMIRGLGYVRADRKVIRFSGGEPSPATAAE